MRGNTFGKMLSMTTFGESHGVAMGVVIDGIPSNLDFSYEKLVSWLQRRRPGGKEGVSARVEEDIPEVLSGIFNNKTLGTPIAVIIKNTGQKSSDYEVIKDKPRPGHADQVTMDKYHIRDYRGGGRASGRETVSRVVAGYFASMVLPKLEIELIKIELGDGKIFTQIDDLFPHLAQLQKSFDSVGGEIFLKVKNCPKALGEPVFDKLKADLAKALLSIGGCISFSVGDKFLVNKKGSEIISNLGLLGGIEGGISSGNELILTISFKAPVSVGDIAKKGRHDPCIIPRAIPVAESMIRFVIADHYLRQRAYE
jgi:chorismate synthase